LLRFVAYIASDQNKVKNVFVKCTKCKNARQVTFEKSTDVRNYYWTGVENVIIYLRDNDGDENWKLFKKNISDAEMAANPEKRTVISDRKTVQARIIAITTRIHEYSSDSMMIIQRGLHVCEFAVGMKKVLAFLPCGRLVH
ncbi:hypothetical protein COOONC_13404, partial [Cooperia oncophora]